MTSKDYKQKFNIPFSDLSLQYNQIKSQVDKAIKNVFKKSDFILGEQVRFFEQEFAKYCNTKYAVGVDSGTDALFLALKALGIDSDDEVIVPAFTYIATAFAVSHTGARPVFIDIEPDTYNISIESLKKAITKKTKVIIPVHLYGHSAEMEPLLDLAIKHNLKIIEDAAQAHGAVYKPLNKKCGSIGDLGCFSFYPSKNLGACGDGGMITVNEDDVYYRLLKLRDYGRINKYTHEIIGFNARLDTLQAAILRIKLENLDKWNDLRRQAANIYNNHFTDVPGAIRPIEKDYAHHIYHIYALRIKNRDKIIGHLKKKGIGCLIHYPIPLHLQPAYKHLGYKENDFPVAEMVAKEIISLPLFPYIKEEQIRLVAESIKEVAQ